MAAGNRHDFLDVAEWLEPFDKAMADLYAQRTRKDAAAVAKWMDDETYMSGSMAVERGFADTIMSSDTLTVDESAKAAEREVNKLRAMELRLMRGGESRTEARSHINEMRGTTDSAPPAGTTDSAGFEDWSGLSDLIATLRS